MAGPYSLQALTESTLYNVGFGSDLPAFLNVTLCDELLPEPLEAWKASVI
jgi:hypothetical protein